jgi:hypothetical protein
MKVKTRVKAGSEANSEKVARFNVEMYVERIDTR